MLTNVPCGFYPNGNQEATVKNQKYIRLYSQKKASNNNEGYALGNARAHEAENSTRTVTCQFAV